MGIAPGGEQLIQRSLHQDEKFENDKQRECMEWLKGLDNGKGLGLEKVFLLPLSNRNRDMATDSYI